MMRTTILAGMVALAMAAPAMAGSVEFGSDGSFWGSFNSIDGYGYGAVYSTQQPIDFTISDGSLMFGYQPPDPDEPWLGASGYIDLDLGSAGIDIVANLQVQGGMSGDELWISAMYGLGGGISAYLTDDPSVPATWKLSSVYATTPYHGIDGGLEFTFYGGPAAAVPEPPTALILAAGLGGVGLLGRRRRVAN